MPITTTCPTSQADVDVTIDNAAVLVDEDRCAFAWRCSCGELHSRTIEPGTAANLVAAGANRDLDAILDSGDTLTDHDVAWLLASETTRHDVVAVAIHEWLCALDCGLSPADKRAIQREATAEAYQIVADQLTFGWIAVWRNCVGDWAAEWTHTHPSTDPSFADISDTVLTLDLSAI